jgi:hypothetical protein
MQGNTDIVADIRVGRIERVRALAVDQSLLKSFEVEQRRGSLFKDSSVVWLQLLGQVEIGKRLLQSPLLEQDQTAPKGVCVTWIEFEGTLIARQSIDRVPELGLAGVELHGPVERPERLLMASLMFQVASESAKVICLPPVGGGIDGAFSSFLGFPSGRPAFTTIQRAFHQSQRKVAKSLAHKFALYQWCNDAISEGVSSFDFDNFGLSQIKDLQTPESRKAPEPGQQAALQPVIAGTLTAGSDRLHNSPGR